MKKVIYTILLLCLSLIITIILGEILLRIMWVKPTGVDVSAITTKDEMLGFSFVPNSAIIISGQMNDYQTSVKINSQGFRGREHQIENKLKKRRIILIGDSVVFGLGTAEEENIDVVIEKLLNANSTTSYEVINLGMPGIGTLAEEQVLKLYGIKYKPDIVVLFVNAINDLGDNLNYNNLHNINYSSATDNTTTDNTDTLPLLNIKESYLYDFGKWQLRPFLFKSHLLRKAILFFYKPSVEELPSSVKEWYTGEWDTGISLMKAALQRSSILSKQHNFKMSVAVIPSRPQFDINYEYLLEAVMTSDMKDKYNNDSRKPQRIIREFCKDNSIHYIELLDDLIHLQNKGISLTYPNDGHPKAPYNLEIAKIVVRELLKNGSL